MENAIGGVDLKMNNKLTIIILIMITFLTTGCPSNKGDSSMNNNLYIQNSKNRYNDIKIYLDDKLVFDEDISTTDKRPAIVKELFVKDIVSNKTIKVIINKKEYSEKINNTTIEILINLDYPKMLIQQYDEKIKFK